MAVKFFCNADNKSAMVMLIRFMNTVSTRIGFMECWDVYKADV